MFFGFSFSLFFISLVSLLGLFAQMITTTLRIVNVFQTVFALCCVSVCVFLCFVQIPLLAHSERESEREKEKDRHLVLLNGWEEDLFGGARLPRVAFSSGSSDCAIICFHCT